jgi:hypothetical protein
MSVVYRLIDPRNQSTRYVGLTENLLTRFIQHLRCVDKNARKNDWIHELDRLGLVPIAEQLELITDRSIAAKRERHWMQHYRYLGHDLFNAALPAAEIKPALEIEEETPSAQSRIPRIRGAAAKRMAKIIKKYPGISAVDLAQRAKVSPTYARRLLKQQIE